MDIALPRPLNRASGAPIDTLHLTEPTLRQLQESEKEVSGGYSAVTVRARDIALLSLVTKIDQAELRTLPISIVARATAFLREFIERRPDDIWADNPPDALTIPLDTPLRAVNGEEYTDITLTEPTTGAVEAAERALRKGSNSVALRAYQEALLSRSTDMHISAIHALPVTKVDEATRFIQVFINAGRPTGER